MHQQPLPLIFVVLSLLVAQSILAASVQTELTPEHLHDQSRFDFSMKTQEDEGDLVRFEFSATWKANVEQSPFFDSTLQIIDDAGVTVASCPIQCNKTKEGYRCTFSVARKFLKHSKFTFTEYAFVKEKDEKGNQQIVPMPSADFYHMSLSQFSSPNEKRETK